MQAKSVVYVLVSDPADFYFDMLRLSITLLRKYNPTLRVAVATDTETAEHIKAKAELITQIDSLIIAQDEELSLLNRTDKSRFIKTSLRKRLAGDFVYIDIDAFPVGDLQPILDAQHSISMAYDQNVKPQHFILEDYEAEIFKKLSWPTPNVYFNGGVILAKDDENAHRLFQDWHTLWKESRLTGNHKDQPALHEAIRRGKHNIGTLPKEANLLISLAPRCRWGKPIIYHISTIRFNERSDTHFHKIIKDIGKTGRIDLDEVDRIRTSRYPWTNRNMFWHSFYTGNFSHLPRITIHKVLRKILRKK